MCRGCPCASSIRSSILERTGLMTAAHRPQPHSPAAAAAVIDCKTALLTAYTDGRVTIIRIAGEIDAANVDDLTRQARSLVPAGNALILDLANVDFIGVDGLRALLAVNIECARCNSPWAMIASQAVTRLLRVGDRDVTLPAVGSPTEALLLLRSPDRSRRHLVALTDSESGG